MKYLDDKKQWDKYVGRKQEQKNLFQFFGGFCQRILLSKIFAKFIAKKYDIKGKVVCEIEAGLVSLLGHLKRLGASKCAGGLFPRND